MPFAYFQMFAYTGYRCQIAIAGVARRTRTLDASVSLSFPPCLIFVISLLLLDSYAGDITTAPRRPPFHA